MHSVTAAGSGRPAADPADPADSAGAADPADHAGPADSGFTESAGPAVTVEPAARRARLLTGLAAAGIGGSILIRIAASLVRDSWMYPPVALPGWGPPWDLESVRVPVAVVTIALWTTVIAGLGGRDRRLAAVRLGARPSARGLLVAAAVAVAVLTVLPPAGSTDAFDCAACGRMLALGHSPYVMTPYHLRLAHNAFAWPTTRSPVPPRSGRRSRGRRADAFG